MARSIIILLFAALPLASQGADDLLSAYDRGLAFARTKQFASAIAAWQSVQKQDERYQDAQHGIVRAYQRLAEEAPGDVLLSACYVSLSLFHSGERTQALSRLRSLTSSPYARWAAECERIIAESAAGWDAGSFPAPYRSEVPLDLSTVRTACFIGAGTAVLGGAVLNVIAAFEEQRTASALSTYRSALSGHDALWSAYEASLSSMNTKYIIAYACYAAACAAFVTGLLLPAQRIERITFLPTVTPGGVGLSYRMTF